MTELDAILHDLERAVTADAAPAARRLDRRRVALALPLLLAVAAALYAGLGVGHEPSASAARQRLEHAAQLVSSAPAPVIGPGQYWYVKGVGAFTNSAGTASGTYTARQTATHEIWIAGDASGRIVRRDGPPQFYSDAERARWEAAGEPGFNPSHGIDESEPAGAIAWGWESLGVHSAADVPTDPAALEQLVARSAAGTKNPLPWEEFTVISDVLRFAPLSGAQTAAFYQVLANLPGIELVGPVEDALGRPGTAFAVERGDELRSELILDSSTGRLLGSQDTLVRPDPLYAGAPVGTVIGYETIAATGVVDSPSARP